MELVGLGDLVVCSILLNFFYLMILNKSILKIIDRGGLSKCKIFNNGFVKEICSVVFCIINFLFGSINLDYNASKCSKNYIRNKSNSNKKSSRNKQSDDNDYKRYIKYKNKWNLGFFIAVFTFVIFVIIRYKQGVLLYDGKNDLPLTFLYIFLFIRFMSRSLEIIIAFYKDILDGNENSSGLEPHERFGLAVNSLIELIIRGAAIYLLLHMLNYGIIESVISNTFSSIYISIINSINFASMYSSEYIFGGEDKSIFAYIFGCKNEFMDVYNFIGRSVVVLQGVASFVLIILSFAQYLSGVKDEAKAQGQEQDGQCAQGSEGSSSEAQRQGQGQQIRKQNNKKKKKKKKK